MRELECNLIGKYESYLRLERGLTDNSIKSYISDINKYIDFIGRDNITISALEGGDITEFLCQLNDLGIHPRSQARVISGIKSFFNYLKLEDYIKVSPAQNIESPKIGSHLPEVLSIEELDLMINSFDLSLPEGRRNRAIVEVMYSCGLRVSELVGLNISSIYSDEMFITVTGKGRKQRLIPLSDNALNEINLYLIDRSKITPKKGDEDALFLNRRGGRLSRVMVFYIIKNICENSGITKSISPHTLRHTFATHMIEGGANLRAIQEMLGHESITTTEIYLHMNREFLRSEILNHHPRNKKGKNL